MTLDREPAHTVTLGEVSLRVFPARNWLVLARRRGGQVNTLGFTGDDIADVAALLNTAGAWLADHREGT